jgi:hypothetical protein
MCYSEDVNTKKSSNNVGGGGSTTKAVATASLRAFRAASTDSTASSSSMASNNSSRSNNSDYDGEEEWNDSPTPSRAQDEDDTQSFGSTDSSSNTNNKKVKAGDVAVRSSHRRNKNQTPLSSSPPPPSLSLLSHLGWIVAGVVAAGAKIGFSLWFPFALAPLAANATYHWAFYNYDPVLSHFDNTAWTYGTDYGLAVITATLATVLLRTGHGSPAAHALVYRMAALLLLYCASVTAGGYAHQFFLTLEDRNTRAFRLTWTICVGTVCAASTAMGMCGSNLLRQCQYQLEKESSNTSPNHQQQKPKNFGSNALLHLVPVLPDTFWIAFGAAVTVFCAWGGLSFQRPACDIFVAGITQTPSTFYIMIVFGLVQHQHVSNRSKVLGLLGFIGNAPLLPAYPLFVQYSNLSLGTVNALLHCCLCTSWTMQGISILQMTKALMRHERGEEEQRGLHLLLNQEEASKKTR